MRLIVYFVCLVLVGSLAGCTEGGSLNVNFKEINIIETLNQFDSQAENEQLGKDLLSYNFGAELRLFKPEISLKQLQGIKPQYFIQEESKEVSFRLILSGDALTIKGELISFFESSIKGHIEKHVSQKDQLNEAVDWAIINFDFLLADEDSLFLANVAKAITMKTDSIDLINMMNQFREGLPHKDERVLMNRHYYESMPNAKGSNFYIVNFNSEAASSKVHQLTIQKESGGLKIVGWRH